MVISDELFISLPLLYHAASGLLLHFFVLPKCETSKKNDINKGNKHTWTKPMEGGPKSLKAGLKLDEEGRDGEGTEEPVNKEDSCEKMLLELKNIIRVAL